MAVESSPSEHVVANLNGLLPELETIYKDIHSHPELSMQGSAQRVWLRTACARPAMK